MASDNVAALVEEFEEKLKVDAKNCIVQKFPERLLLLKEILSKPEFHFSGIGLKFAMDVPSLKIESHVTKYVEKNEETRPHQDSNKHDAFPEQALIPCNKILIEIMNTLKYHIKLLFEDVNSLKMWISLLIPKIECENSLGFAVKKKTCATIQSIEDEFTEYFSLVTWYHTYRSKLISQVMKYPLIEDYRQAIYEWDEQQHLSLSILMHAIFDNYLYLYDFFNKNWDTITKPQSSNISSMY